MGCSVGLREGFGEGRLPGLSEATTMRQIEKDEYARIAMESLPSELRNGIPVLLIGAAVVCLALYGAVRAVFG